MSHAAAEIKRAWNGERMTHFAAPSDKTIAAIRKLIRPGDAVLVKASRGMGLERVIAAFEKQDSPEPSHKPPAPRPRASKPRAPRPRPRSIKAA
jgi:hypothetical protein